MGQRKSTGEMRQSNGNRFSMDIPWLHRTERVALRARRGSSRYLCARPPSVSFLGRRPFLCQPPLRGRSYLGRRMPPIRFRICIMQVRWRWWPLSIAVVAVVYLMMISRSSASFLGGGPIRSQAIIANFVVRVHGRAGCPSIAILIAPRVCVGDSAWEPAHPLCRGAACRRRSRASFDGEKYERAAVWATGMGSADYARKAMLYPANPRMGAVGRNDRKEFSPKCPCFRDSARFARHSVEATVALPYGTVAPGDPPAYRPGSAFNSREIKVFD
jgi:hypothetical protein